MIYSNSILFQIVSIVIKDVSRLIDCISDWNSYLVERKALRKEEDKNLSG
jgi:hypothetical protein